MFHKTSVVTVLTHGSENWALTNKYKRILESA